MIKLILFITLVYVGVLESHIPKECVIPFNFKGFTFNKCTDMNSDYLWCATKKDYDGTSVSCSSEEQEQRLKRDNYFKLFRVLQEQQAKIDKIVSQHGNNTKCVNCGPEVNAIVQSLGALDNIAEDHFRKLIALKQKFIAKQKFADALLKKVKKINEFAMRATKRRTKDTWYGTAPFCGGSCPAGQKQLRRDSRGDGKKCWTGSKALCRRVYFV